MGRQLLLMLAISGSLASGPGVQEGEWRPRISRLPCRLVVKGTLLEAIERGWDQSSTFKRQCEDLAAARAVVSLTWDQPHAQWHARTRMGAQDGIVVAYVAVPPVEEAVGYVAHELQHVLERIRGLDFEAESKRAGSGVWRAASGDFETQAAIDAGRQVWKEVSGSPGVK
jgi:hypothetical protein